MDKNVIISIIMPVYNSEKYLKECIESILNQDFDSFELMLIDDGSTDNSPEICDEFAKNDSRVKVYHKKNGGICEARNFGMQYAVGEYIAFSDHDDLVKESFLKDNYEFIKNNKVDVLKFGRESLIIKDGIVERKNIRRFKREIITHEEVTRYFLRMRFNGAMTCVWDGFYKREFLEKNNIQFNTQYKKGGEDIDFCSRCFVKASSVAFNNTVSYIHNIRVGYSTSTKEDDQRLIKFKMLASNLDQCVDALGILKKGCAYFSLCITKELVYPSLVYFYNLGVDVEDIEEYMKNECEQYRKYSPGNFSLILRNVKWGLFSVLFKYGLYKVMFRLLRYKK